MDNYLKEIFLIVKKKASLGIILILFLAAFLRFYNISNVVRFEYDEEYNSYLVYDLVKNHHLSLIGQEGSFGGIHWGPWHYLYLVPFYMTTNLHPLGGYIGEAILGLLIIFSYFYAGSKLFSTRVGLLAAFLRSIIYTLFLNDLTISPAYPSELVAIWFLYFLVKFRLKEKNSTIFLAFLFGMMFSVHVVLFPLVLVWIFVAVVDKPIKLNIKLFTMSILAFILPMLPLLMFEIKHRFAHLTYFLHYLAEKIPGQTIGQRITYLIYYNTENFYRMFDKWFLPAWLGPLILAGIIYCLWKKQGLFKSVFYKSLFLLTFFSVIIYYFFYPRNVPPYYFLALTPLTILFVSALFIELTKSIFGKILFSIFLIVVIYTNFKLIIQEHTMPGKFSLAYKQQAVESIINHQKGKGDFSVSYITDFGRNYGFKYLFTYYGVEPRPFTERKPVYTIVVPAGIIRSEDLSEVHGDIGLIFPEKEHQVGF